MLGKPLEERRGGRHRHLNERRLAACPHDGNQPVDGRLPIVLETVQELDPLDERAVLLQPQHDRRLAEQTAHRPHASIGVRTLQCGLDHALMPLRTGDRQPRGRRRGVMHLERHGRLTGKQTPPPAAKQALVQHLEHRHHGLGAGPVRAIRLNPQTHVATTAANVVTRESNDECEPEQERHEQPRGRDACQGDPAPACAHALADGAPESRERRDHERRRAPSRGSP